jgi:hypothetical protein
MPLAERKCCLRNDVYIMQRRVKAMKPDSFLFAPKAPLH